MLLRNARLGDLLVDVRITGQTIVAVTPSGAGSSRDASADDSVDAGGRWVIPGLWDHHTHFDQWALRSSRLDVSAASSAAETARLVAAADRGSGGIVVATGFRDGLWPDAPSRALLDTASTDPVVVISGDLHAAWLNSAAFRHFRRLGVIPYDDRPGDSRHPDGLLREGDAFAVVGRLDASTHAELDALAAAAAARAAARGVVGIVDYEMADNGPAWQRRSAAGRLPLRIEFGIYRQHLDVAIERGYRTSERLPGGDRVRVGNLKIIIDGSLNTRTAYCFDAYAGLAGPAAFGMLTVQPEELLEVLTQAATAGIAASVHAIGDRANAVALDAFERLGSRLGGHTLRGNRIEHAQLVADSDLSRFAVLQVAASVQPEHAMDDRDVADRYWPGRTRRAFPLRSLLDSGATLLFGSDAPVSPLDPLTAIAAAVRRTRGELEPARIDTAQREAWHPEQAISVAEALAASARSSIAPHQPADLVLLDGDPELLATADGALPGVGATVLAGDFTHRSF